MSRSAIADKELKILCLRSGNRCAFPGCTRALVLDGADANNPVVVAQVAHITADSPKGPRGSGESLREANSKYENLILLCGEHHKLVDSQPYAYSVPVLREMKAAHEKRVN